MRTKSSFNFDLEAIEKGLETLRNSTRESYLQKVKLLREQQAALADRGEQSVERILQILDKNKIDPKMFYKSLREKEAEEQKELDHFLATTRTEWVKQYSETADRYNQEKLARSMLLQQEGWQEIPYLGAETLSTEESVLGESAQKIGNPGAYYIWNTGKKLQIKDRHWGKGCGCRRNPVRVPTEVSHYFSWVPTEWGIWDFWVYYYYNGFYIILANDDAFSCKRAYLSGFVEFNLTQFPLILLQKKDTFLDISSDHIMESHQLLESRCIFFQAPLYPMTAYMKVTTSLFADAKGSGSYAEVNFKDGASLYITAPEIWAKKKL